MNQQYKHQYECLDEHCKTIIFDSRNRDGLRCPRCNCPVIPRPYSPNFSEEKPDTKVNMVPLIRMGILTINEVRKHHGLCPIPNGNELYKC